MFVDSASVPRLELERRLPSCHTPLLLFALHPFLVTMDIDMTLYQKYRLADVPRTLGGFSKLFNITEFQGSYIITSKEKRQKDMEGDWVAEKAAHDNDKCINMSQCATSSDVRNAPRSY